MQSYLSPFMGGCRSAFRPTCRPEGRPAGGSGHSVIGPPNRMKHYTGAKPICLNRPFSPPPTFPARLWRIVLQKIAGGGPVQAATNFCFLFDFDEWSRLAKIDPTAFEARRLALIEEYLRRFPPLDQRRLRGLQFRIDMERRRARTPMAACLRLSSMMWESLLGNHGLKMALDTLLGYTDRMPATARRQMSATTARVLPFRKPAH
jgi:Protein of unknown function (DUF3135)